MGLYRQRKMEYFKGSGAALRLYQGWITVFALFSVVMLTWKITTSGYTEPVYFLLDFLVCGFAVIGTLSFAGFDRYTVFGNVGFLLVFLSARVYKTLHFMGAFGGGGASAGEVVNMDSAMGGVDAALGGMNAAMGGMDAMSGIGMGMDMGVVSAAAVSPDMGLLGQLVQKLMNGPLKVSGDLSKFIIVLECELYGVLCVFFIVLFLSNWSFFKTPLAQLREKES